MTLFFHSWFYIDIYIFFFHLFTNTQNVISSSTHDTRTLFQQAFGIYKQCLTRLDFKNTLINEKWKLIFFLTLNILIKINMFFLIFFLNNLISTIPLSCYLKKLQMLHVMLRLKRLEILYININKYCNVFYNTMKQTKYKLFQLIIALVDKIYIFSICRLRQHNLHYINAPVSR